MRAQMFTWIIVRVWMFVCVSELWSTQLGVWVCVGVVKTVDESACVCVCAARLHFRANTGGSVLLPDLPLYSDPEIR